MRQERKDSTGKRESAASAVDQIRNSQREVQALPPYLRRHVKEAQDAYERERLASPKGPQKADRGDFG